MQITAVSHADATKSANSNVKINSDVAVVLAPNTAAVELGATRGFHAAVSSSGHPDTSVHWSVSGAACSSGCGAVDTNGNFTAPQILPIPAAAVVTAQSVADPAKQASAALTITSNFLLQLSAPASVPTGGSATIAATFTPVPGSNPSQVLSWSLSGDAWSFVRGAHGGDHAIGGRISCGGFRDLHRAGGGAQPKHRNNYGDAPSRPIKKSTGHAGEKAPASEGGRYKGPLRLTPEWAFLFAWD